NVPRHLRLEPPSDAAAANAAVFKPRVAPAQTTRVQGNGFVGGPRLISVQLTATTPFSRSGLHDIVRSGGAFHRTKGPHNLDSPDARDGKEGPAASGIRTEREFQATFAASREERSALPVVTEEVATPAMEPVAAAKTEPFMQEQAVPQLPPPREERSALPVV